MLPSEDLPRPVSTVRASNTLRGALRRTFGSLDTRNYRLYFTGDLVSHVGSWMQTMAEAWLVSTLTGSGVAVGATFAFRFLPVLLFGLWGGTVADRFDRRKVLLVTQTLAAVLAVALWLIVLTGVVQVWMVFTLAIALGFVTVVDEPARHAFVEEMVGRDRLPNAVALTSAVGNSARITGPASAGLLIATVGTAWVFFVNALSFSRWSPRWPPCVPPSCTNRTGTPIGRAYARGWPTRGASPRFVRRSCWSPWWGPLSTTSRRS
jgi:MFS family permease